MTGERNRKEGHLEWPSAGTGYYHSFGERAEQ